MKSVILKTHDVNAILDDGKTQTRRIVPTEWIQSDKAPIPTHGEDGCIWHFWNFGEKQSKYKTDDILYVREPVKVMSPPVETCRKLTFKYLADNKTTDIYLDDNFDYSKKWIQRCQGVPNGCIKEMARIFLKVTSVRVERLQDNSYVFVYEFERIDLREVK